MPLVLRKPRAEVERLLRARIRVADDLLAAATKGSPDVGREISKWSDYNKDLLGGLFAGDSALHEYLRVGAVSIIDRRSSLEVLQRRQLLAQKEKLESFCERLEIAEEPSRPGSVTVTTNTNAVQVGTPAPARTRPRLFVGSSTEGLDVAHEIQALLDHNAEVEVWTQGAFQPSQGNLASLVSMARQVDFAALVLSGDDLLQKRSTTPRASPRDNVLFELGLFIGALGPERVFIVRSRVIDLDLPSDLAGVSALTYEPHSTQNLRAALGAACTDIRKAMSKLGPLQ